MRADRPNGDSVAEAAPSRVALRRSLAACPFALLGLLLWARILVIHDVPKHAVAGDEDPPVIVSTDEVQAAPAPPVESSATIGREPDHRPHPER